MAENHLSLEPYEPPIPRFQGSVKRLARVLVAPWKVCFPPPRTDMASLKEERRDSVSSHDSAVFSYDGKESPAASMREQRERKLSTQLNETRHEIRTMRSKLAATKSQLKASEEKRRVGNALVRHLSRQAVLQKLQRRITFASQQHKSDQKRIKHLEHQVNAREARESVQIRRYEDLILQNKTVVEGSQRELQGLHELRKVNMAYSLRIAQLQQANAQSEQEIADLKAERDSLGKIAGSARRGRQDSRLPEVIAKAFTDLSESVSLFVLDKIGPLENEQDLRDALLQRSKTHPEEAAWLRDQSANNLNVLKAKFVMETDIDTFPSMIWDQLMQWIFSRDENFMYTRKQSLQLRVIKDLEKRMNAGNINPGDLAKELHTISLWRYKGIQTIFQADDMKKGHLDIANYFSESLGRMLSPIHDSRVPGPNAFKDFVTSIKTDIIEPALALYDLMIQERNLYYLDFNHFIDPQHPDLTSDDFYKNFESHDCEIVQPGKRLKLKDSLVNDELINASVADRRDLLKRVCVKTPALLTQIVSDTAGTGEPMILVKQQVAVLVGGIRGLQATTTFLQDLTA